MFFPDGPVLNKKPEDVSGDSGKEVLLECMAEGNPSPTYRWLRKYDHTEVIIVIFRKQLTLIISFKLSINIVERNR